MPNFESLTSDFSLKYNETYIQYRATPQQEFTTAFVSGVTPQNNDFPFILLESYNYGLLNVKYNGEGEFRFTLPEVGYFQHAGNSYVGARRPSRQNKRALCQENWTISNFYTNLKINLTPRLDLKKANSIFNPSHYTLETALDRLNNKKSYLLSLSNTYAIGLNVVENKNHLLFADIAPIAEISEDGQITNIFNKIFERLVADAPL